MPEVIQKSRSRSPAISQFDCERTNHRVRRTSASATAADTTPRKFSTISKTRRSTLFHRRGKHVLFDLDNGRTLITHLRMSGKFMLLDHDAVDPKFTHAVLYFDGQPARVSGPETLRLDERS
jgi:formamidopyrimidine-DNA glycosylase